MSPPTTTAPAARGLTEEILAEIERIGPRVEVSFPLFQAFYLVGPAALGELDLLESGSIWVCGSELSFVLVTAEAIPSPTLRCLQAGIGMRLGGMRVRLRHFHAAHLEAQVPKYREGFELVEARKLLAGSDRSVDRLAISWARREAPEAAENLLAESLEFLLRAWPQAPLLTRQSFEASREKQILKGALAELARDWGDALLLLRGRYEAGRAARHRAVSKVFPPTAVRGRILDWAFDRQPLLAEPGVTVEELWQELREGIVEALAVAASRTSRKSTDDPESLIHNVRGSRRSLSSRLRRLLRGGRRAGGREFTLLCLILALTGGGAQDDKRLLARAARLLPRLGGPILCHPSWAKIRRESLLLQPWEHRLSGPAPVASRLEAEPADLLSPA